MDRSLLYGKQNERFITVNERIFINPGHRPSTSGIKHVTASIRQDKKLYTSPHPGNENLDLRGKD